MHSVEALFAEQFSFFLVGNREFLASLGAAAGENRATLFGRHAFQKAVGFSAFALLRLVCSFGHTNEYL